MMIWKTRIGGLKPLAFFGAILTALLALVAIADLILSLQNPTGQPRPVGIEAVVLGKVASGQYVTISGEVKNITLPDTEKGKAGQFFLSDPLSGSVLLVQSSSLIKPAEGSRLELSGLLHLSSTAIENRVATAVPGLTAGGFKTTPKIFLNEGETLPTLDQALVRTGGLLMGFVLCLLAMSMPYGVFVPQPVNKVEPGGREDGVINPLNATGSFQKLSRVTPPYEFDKEFLKLHKVKATFERAGDWFVVRYRQYKRYRFFGFVTTKIQVYDWAVAIHNSSSAKFESGRFYEWGAKPALRLTYKDRQGNSQKVLLWFKDEAAWTKCVRILEELRLDSPPS